MKPQNANPPQQPNAQKQNFYTRQPYHPHKSAPFQPRKQNVKGKLNNITKVKGEPENTVIE
ncbi:hypothetical protein MKW98_029877, partial [Papaver atlanticum]